MLSHGLCSKAEDIIDADAQALEEAREFGINVSAVADAALVKAVAEARRKKWLLENADRFVAQSDWHECHGHPLADIIATPGGGAWAP